jgi:DNA helicase-2/ATP-dependent DNA helicase PcrA
VTAVDPQGRAANSAAANLLVLAPPGCGKTELLALRAEALIPRLGPNQKILALTFTNRAKSNLGERLRRLLGAESVRRHVAIHNFHGHAAEIVLAHGRSIGLSPDELKMPSTKSLRKTIESFSADPTANAAVAELLGSIKRASLTDEEVLAVLDAAGSELGRLVEAERVGRQELHYEDLLRHAQRLLGIAEVSNLYCQHYGAVLVDEFQDLSPQQLDIVLKSCVSSRTFAGDPLQGIYSWAGARPKEIESSLRALCGEVVDLAVSYRSSPAVLAMVNGVSAEMGASELEAYDPAAWTDGGASAALSASTLASEARFIVAASRRIVEAEPTASVGVITRSGWRRTAIDEAFAAALDVPSRRWDLAIEDPNILDRLRSAISAMPPSVSFEEARDAIVGSIDAADVDTIEQVDEAFAQLAQVALGSVRATLDQFRFRSDETSVESGVHLLNAHTGKGQQFDWVFVPGLEEKHLPDQRSTSGDLLAEEMRVLLVMLSRARHGLVTTTVRTLDGRYGPYSAQVSRWWGTLAGSATMDQGQLSAHFDRVYPARAAPDPPRSRS